jgi:HSP20 family protein
MFDLFREMEGMFPARRGPWRELPMENAFTPAFMQQRMLPAPREAAIFFPAVECFTREGQLVLKAELPGVDPAAIEIAVAGDRLTMRGEKKEEKKVEDKDLFFKETCFGRFERTFTLPEGVKSDQVKASFMNGVLELTMPAVASMTVSKVPIQVGDAQKKTVKAA